MVIRDHESSTLFVYECLVEQPQYSQHHHWSHCQCYHKMNCTTHVCRSTCRKPQSTHHVARAIHWVSVRSSHDYEERCQESSYDYIPVAKRREEKAIAEHNNTRLQRQFYNLHFVFSRTSSHRRFFATSTET